MGDGAEIRYKFIPGHADAGIGNGQDMILVVTIYCDLKGNMRVEFRFFNQALVAVFFQGIRSIGNQLPDKNITFRVERINDNIKDFPGFCLEFMSFQGISHGKTSLI